MPRRSSRGGSRERRSLRGALGVEHAELVAQHVADLADGATGPERLAHRREQVRLAARRLPDVLESRRSVVGAALSPHARRPLELPALRLGVEAVQLDALGLRLGVAVDADDDPIAGLDLLRVREGGLIDLL